MFLEDFLDCKLSHFANCSDTWTDMDESSSIFCMYKLVLLLFVILENCFNAHFTLNLFGCHLYSKASNILHHRILKFTGDGQIGDFMVVMIFFINNQFVLLSKLLNFFWFWSFLYLVSVKRED